MQIQQDNDNRNLNRDNTLRRHAPDLTTLQLSILVTVILFS